MKEDLCLKITQGKLTIKELENWLDDNKKDDEFIFLNKITLDMFKKLYKLKHDREFGEWSGYCFISFGVLDLMLFGLSFL